MNVQIYDNVLNVPNTMVNAHNYKHISNVQNCDKMFFVTFWIMIIFWMFRINCGIHSKIHFDFPQQICFLLHFKSFSLNLCSVSAGKNDWPIDVLALALTVHKFSHISAGSVANLSILMLADKSKHFVCDYKIYVCAEKRLFWMTRLLRNWLCYNYFLALGHFDRFDLFG